MKIETMKISELKPAEKNIRIHGFTQLKEFERSVRMFGQIRPVVVDENNVILCGNGLYETMKNMEIENIDVYRVEGLNSNQKKKLMISDNKIYALGVDDLNTFDAFINELRDDLDIPGYDDEMLRSLVADAEEITDIISEYGTLDEEEINSIKVNSEKKDKSMNEELTPNNRPVRDEKNTEVCVERTEPIGENSEMETAELLPITEQRRFVVCTKCGEKIWL
ncbi:MAG: ParB/Srx family N-terminal domain-containing protein [bacterium]|nr:ParB/Srx family N-terminal domain-containing protein [bacterium]